MRLPFPFYHIMSMDNNDSHINIKTIAQDKKNSLRDRLNCIEWAALEGIRIIGEIGDKDLLLISALSHNSLKEVYLEDALLKELNSDLFANCNSLEKIHLPSDITILPSRIFKNCRNLKTVNLPKDLDCIQENAFENCESLNHLIIPSSVNLLKENVFLGCRNLESITITAPHPPVCNMGALNGIPENAKIYVKKGISTEINASDWKKYDICIIEE